MEPGLMDLQSGTLTTRPQRWSALETAARESVVAMVVRWDIGSTHLANVYIFFYGTANETRLSMNNKKISS
jgi:hypothetical protein